MDMSKERNMFVIAEHFLSDVVDDYGSHPVPTDKGTLYPQACRFLKLAHHIHSSFEKSIIERTIQYVKDRLEEFGDSFPYKKNKCNLNHIKQWFKLFADKHNKEIIS